MFHMPAGSHSTPRPPLLIKRCPRDHSFRKDYTTVLLEREEKKEADVKPLVFLLTYLIKESLLAVFDPPH